MIPDDHAKSFLSKSYVNAVATQAGYGCQFKEPDYGIDAEISEIQFIRKGKYVSTGVHFNVQMKATHDFEKNEDEIIYALDSDAYNRLIAHTGGLIILVLFCLPKNPLERVFLSENCLELRNCCYWYHLTGSFTENTSSKTIYIPRTHIFNPISCQNMMDLVRNGDWSLENVFPSN